MKTTWLVIFPILLAASCKNKKTQENIPGKDYSFHVGYDASPMFCGAVSMPDDTNQYLYFADVQTNKCINVFTMESPQPLFSVPLKRALDTLESIHSLTIQSLDTIILLSAYTNKMAVMNRLGECYRFIDLNKHVNLPNGDVYELSGSYLNSEASVNAITLRAEWRSNRFDDISGKTPETDLENFLYWYDRNYHAAYLASVSGIFDDSAKVNFGLNDFHLKAGGSDHVYIDDAAIARANHRVFIFSKYLNTITEVNPVSLKIIKQTPITSAFAKLDAKPLKIETKSISKFQEYADDISNMEAYVAGFNYDHHKHVYYLTLCHKLPKGAEEEQGYKKRPFSIMVLDENLKRIDEVTFTDGRYFAANILTKHGLMIYKLNDDLKYETITYTLLHLH